MVRYFCTDCRIEFETDKPVKKEYTDYLLGPCSRNVAYCPECGHESGEKLIPKPGKRSIQNRPDYCDGDCRRCG